MLNRRTEDVAMAHINSKHSPEIQDLDPDLLKAFEHLVRYLQRGHVTESERANYADTAVRAAKGFKELTATREEISVQLRDILKTGFPSEPRDDGNPPGLITQGPIQVFSMCPHHLLQVEYEVYVSYIPNKNGGLVLGLSKLARISKLLGKRPILQEQLASDIADTLHNNGRTADPELELSRFPGISSQGGAVLLIGKHSCMSCRGVKSDALSSVTELRGDFWKADMEAKFYQAIAAIRSCGLR